jgi:Tfp pilus assembly protein PilF
MARLIVLSALTLAFTAGSLAAPQDQPATPAQPLQKSIEQLSVAELLAAAQSLRNGGKIADAQVWVARALAKEDKNVEAHDLAGELYLAQERPDVLAAQKEFTTARQLQQNDFRANLGLGKIFAHSRVWRQARFYFLEAERVCPADRVTEICIALAEANRNSGMMQDAFTAVQKAVDNDPTSLEARQMHVALLVDFGALDKALTENDETLRLAKEQVQKATTNRLTPLQNLYRAYDSRVAILQQQIARYFAPLPDGKRSDRLFAEKSSKPAQR